MYISAFRIKPHHQPVPSLDRFSVTKTADRAGQKGVAGAKEARTVEVSIRTSNVTTAVVKGTHKANVNHHLA